MLISVFSIAINLALPLLFLRVWHMGFEALALTTACAVGLECLCLAECLRRKLGGLEGRYLTACFLRVAVAAAAMALPLYFFHIQAAKAFGTTRLGYCSQLAILIPVSVVLFLAAARFLRVQEIGFAFDSFLVPTWKRFSNKHAKIQN
jgi:hypothetical protein